MSGEPGIGVVTSVRVTSSSGRIRIIAEPRSDVAVSGPGEVSQEGGRVTVRVGSKPIELRIPEHIDLVVGTAGARVDVVGLLGAVAVVSESGRVTIEQAATLDVRTTSGRVEVSRVEGQGRVRTESARVAIASAGEADVATKSGRIDLPSVSGAVTAHCVSGLIEIGLDQAADVQAETVSGRIKITVPANLTFRQLTGPLPPKPRTEQTECTIATRSVSGRVSVKRR